MAQAAAKLSGASAGIVNKQNMRFELDGGVAHRAKIGLIVLATDNTIEYEFRRMLQIDGVALYENRIFNDSQINPETLARMEARMADAAADIMPGVELDVIGYGCTSGAMVIGEERVAELIREVRPGVAVTTPITGALAGLRQMKVGRVALLTPYIDDINQMMRRYIEERGIEVPVMGSFNHENDLEVARISLASIRAAALELGSEPNVDGVFISCTSLRLVDIVEDLEAELGKPVTSSNHAICWHTLRLAGYKDPVPGFGRLMRI